MKLWRVEAMHSEGDGALVRYCINQPEAEYAAQMLASCGWFCDVSLSEISFKPDAAVALLEGIWPAEDDETILGLLPANPVAAAAARLQEILSKQRRDDEQGVSDQ